MNRLLQNRLLLQMLFAVLAALSVAALSVVLIAEAIRSAESVVIGEASRTIATAITELKQQYQYRVAADSSWSGLPVAAHDVSLRGITQTVLRSYPGVEGGFYSGSNFLGYAFPTHDTGAAKTDVPSAERGLIVSVVKHGLERGQLVERIVHGRSDLLVLGALAGPKHRTVIWAMKRITGPAPGTGRREALLAILMAAALISIVGTLATGISLARGVTQIRHGLSVLETNFDFHLPERSDELGGISRSINRMASLRRKLETELRREDRLRALGRLAAGMAHEIRNPLNSIRLTVQLLEHRLGNNSIRREDLQTIRSEVDRLSALLNGLLDLQRSRQPRPAVQPILPIIERCIGLIEKQAEMQNTRVCLDSSDPALEACFDPQQLTQALVNLLLNALEASPANGTIYVRALAENRLVKIQVRDEGPGLDTDEQEHLFEPFYTTKPTGTGLGLAVSRELMRSQGGELSYTSTGGGACFVVELPQNIATHVNCISS